MKAILDGDGYPTYETLETISKFKIENEQSIAEFFNYCESAYNKHYGIWEIVEEYDEYVFDRDRLTIRIEYFIFGAMLKIATGGWSGNEMIISAMQENPIWNMRWAVSIHGGVHILFYKKA